MTAQADEVREATKNLAPEIAGLLGPGWVAVPEDDDRSVWRHIHGPESEDLVLYVPYNSRGQIEITGAPPREYLAKQIGGWERTAIGVSVQRGAEAIAKEIQRRLLPLYRPRIGAALQRIAEHDRWEQDRRRRLERFAACLKCKEKDIGDNGLRTHLRRDLGDVSSVEVKLHSEGKVGVELYDIPDDLAVEVLRLVAKHCGAGGKK